MSKRHSAHNNKSVRCINKRKQIQQIVKNSIICHFSLCCALILYWTIYLYGGLVKMFCEWRASSIVLKTLTMRSCLLRPFSRKSAIRSWSSYNYNTKIHSTRETSNHRLHGSHRPAFHAGNCLLPFNHHVVLVRLIKMIC